MNRFSRMLLAGALVAAATPVNAQQQTERRLQPIRQQVVQAPPVPSGGQLLNGPGQFVTLPADANETQGALRELLRAYPPAVREVLQSDPSLLTNAEWMSAYPQLALFVQQHPEVLRDPEYFFGRRYRDEPRSDRERMVDQMTGVLAGAAGLTIGLTIILTIGALAKQLIEYRRWLRQTRTQTDLHTKLMDRMGTNEELLAYMQTPVGRRFLESGPQPIDGDAPRNISAPIGRILWSVQIGVILVALGIGLWIVTPSVMPEIWPAFSVMGTIIAAVGVGFVVSAAISYVLSSRLGLLPARKLEA